MGNLFRKFKKAKGAVTIEATLTLTTFFFFFLTIYSLVTICRAQSTIQVAINSAAKELSQYSYLYSLTGFNRAEGALAEAASGTRSDVNELASNVSDVFNGIQSIGGQVGTIDSIDDVTSEWGDISGTLEGLAGSANDVKEKVGQMIGDDPTRLMFGLAKLMASETLETVKSYAGEAVVRAMVQKNLKRSEDDTAEAYCRAMGIVPGTYCAEKSYFNGIDFSHSQLLPYGTSQIIVVANYKMKLIQLIPIDIELHFTQTAVTTAWMQGDVDIPDTPQAVVGERGESIWNDSTPSERERLIRTMGLTELKNDGYYSVSGSNYIHAYSPGEPQTFAVVRSYNPLADYESVDSVNMVELVERLEKISSQVESSTDNISTVRIKKPDANGNLKTEEVTCTGDENLKVILVIPEDPKLKEKFEEALKSVETDVEFEFLPGYGSVFQEETTEDNVGG